MNINIEDQTNLNLPIPTNTQIHHQSTLIKSISKILKYFLIALAIILSFIITIELSNKILLFFSYEKSNFHFRSLMDTDTLPNEAHITSESINSAAELNSFSEFISAVQSKGFRGKWEAEEAIPHFDELNNEGEIQFRMDYHNIFTGYSNDRLNVRFLILDGNYIDKWININSYSMLGNNLNITNTTFQQEFITTVDYGEIFEKISLNYKCHSRITFNWTDSIKDDHSQSSDYSLFKGSFISDCGFANLTFNLLLANPIEDNNRIALYSVLVSFLAISQIFHSLYLTMKIANSQTYAKSLSLITLGQNIVWNAYGCLCHFFMTVKYEQYSYYFSTPAMLYFINFSIFELRLLYNVWSIKNLRLINNATSLRRKLIQFYFTFYIVMFFALFYVMRFYFNKSYIFAAIMLTWLPQILYNFIYNNKRSMPLINIILMSINRVALPIYIRGFKDNIFQLRADIDFVLLFLICFILEVKNNN